MTNQSRRAPYTVYRIPCWVKSPRARQAIHAVLQRIRESAPEDFERIRARVTEFTEICAPSEKEGLWIELVKRRRRLGPAYFNGPVMISLDSGTSRARYRLARMFAEICIRETDLYKSLAKYGRLNQAKDACVTGYLAKWGAFRKLTSSK